MPEITVFGVDPGTHHVGIAWINPDTHTLSTVHIKADGRPEGVQAGGRGKWIRGLADNTADVIAGVCELHGIPARSVLVAVEQSAYTAGSKVGMAETAEVNGAIQAELDRRGFEAVNINPRDARLLFGLHPTKTKAVPLLRSVLGLKGLTLHEIDAALTMMAFRAILRYPTPGLTVKHDVWRRLQPWRARSKSAVRIPAAWSDRVERRMRHVFRDGKTPSAVPGQQGLPASHTTGPDRG